MSKSQIETSDGEKREINGYKPRGPKPGTKFFKPGSKFLNLPPRVDLRKYMTTIEDQDQLNSCSANAAAGAFEYLIKRNQEVDFDVSRMFLYYNAREIDDSIDEDEGTYISSVIESLNKLGGCSEETWPYNIEAYAKKPDSDSYEEAKKLRIDDYFAIEVNLDQWKQALAEGYPIIFGLNLYDSFESQRKPGVIPNPTKIDINRSEHASHAMLCVGYSDTDRVFIVRNSWGKKWGDKGYCYISYNYMMDSDQNMGDSWVIRQVSEIEDYDDSWEDDSSITGDYDTELAEMSDEDYQEMLDAMGDYPLEIRIAHIILTVAAADGDIHDKEIEELYSYLETTLEKLGVKRSAEKLLIKSIDLIGNDELFEESVTLLNDYLSDELLA
ncbi:MAG: C1 family peptidase, partial [Leptonema sp. (in: Bacteria)]|nr:C1 family peptidase [Leptonema sp. (in: bacteria)]